MCHQHLVEQLFDAIANESFELAFEDQRFWDLVRWGEGQY
jgi:hypothetical protein